LFLTSRGREGIQEIKKEGKGGRKREGVREQSIQ
jgi:hypothetical protein